MGGPRQQMSEPLYPHRSATSSIVSGRGPGAASTGALDTVGSAVGSTLGTTLGVASIGGVARASSSATTTLSARVIGSRVQAIANDGPRNATTIQRILRPTVS